MKTLISTLIALGFITQTSSAVTTESRSVENPKTCALRLGEQTFKSAGDYTPGAAFCAATAVGPKTIVTASHCLDDMRGGPGLFDDLSEVKKSRYFFGAFNDSVVSQTLRVAQGPSAIYATANMSQAKMRKHYSTKGDLKLANEDMVVVQLENPIEGYDASICPRLPSPTDCEELASLLKEATLERPAPLQTHFYRSKYKEIGSGASKEKNYYPDSNILSSQVQTAKVNAVNGYLTTTFTRDGKVVHMKKGDSGSGLIAKLSSGEVIIGVQTAVFYNDDSKGLYAQVCPRIQDARWAQVVGKNAPQTTHAAPVNIPGQRAAGSNR